MTKLAYVVSFDTVDNDMDNTAVGYARDAVEAHFKGPGTLDVRVKPLNEYPGVLMQQGYPTGWKLEDLCDQLIEELTVKSQSIADNRDLGSLTCVANNLQIMSLLEVIRAMQIQTMMTFKCLHGDDPGPMGTPRVPKTDTVKHRVVTMAELSENGNTDVAIGERFRTIRSLARQEGKRIELRLTRADVDDHKKDMRDFGNYRAVSQYLLSQCDRIVIVLESGVEHVVKG
jgi:hypothetical protein